MEIAFKIWITIGIVLVPLALLAVVTVERRYGENIKSAFWSLFIAWFLCALVGSVWAVWRA